VNWVLARTKSPKRGFHHESSMQHFQPVVAVVFACRV
jgi:hypothetical protein